MKSVKLESVPSGDEVFNNPVTSVAVRPWGDGSHVLVGVTGADGEMHYFHVRQLADGTPEVMNEKS